MAYGLVAENNESTVVAEYDKNNERESRYQSEEELENAFIDQLKKQAYEYVQIRSEDELVDNLRRQLEKLNDYHFTDNEWNTFFKKTIACQTDSIENKTFSIQEDYIKLLTRDDGTEKNIYLIDKKNIHNNSLQVLNQYATEQGTFSNRYDVTVLVNGLPLVHIELKRRGIDIKEAFNQINRYQTQSFWSGYGLFEYVQIFVISNGTYTKYYSNTTRFSHIKEMANSTPKQGKKTSNSFEFTSWWADATNRPITDLMDFAKTFFAKHTLLNILTKYCVFTTDKMLLVMRPYQIVATERVLNKIKISTNYKQYGDVKGGGYIWHTTGSGKTLTSFKTAQLASKLPYIEKVLFVVDRSDLDYQTMKEYDKFEKGAANSNTSTVILKKQLENDDARIIITTIQKLTCFIKKYKDHPVFDKHIVILFDECHRSQFGDMHKAITKTFKKYHIFGFTGTPIFGENASSNNSFGLKTTAEAFGDQLHTYTIVDAIVDKNVLPFKIDYIATMKEMENITDEKIVNIDREKALEAPERISIVVSYILNHFNQKTKRNDKSYTFSKLDNIEDVAKNRGKVDEIKKVIRLTGFNSIFAVSSVKTAKLYYEEFQKQMRENPALNLKVATIYSFGTNEEEYSEMGSLDEENTEDTSALDTPSREFLERAIKDYNNMFQTNYDTSSDKFQNYYKDVSLRMKNRELDLLIVVNMFLTGFDATTLNTLWVDKNLRMQGLLQAYSRTNRILNSIKTFGNIVCFRNLEDATNKSISLFGDKNAGGLVLLKTFKEYYEGYTDSNNKEVKGYRELVEKLLADYPIGQMIISEKAKKDFVRLFNLILKLTNILSTFDEFTGKEIITERDFQDYRSVYLDIYHDLRQKTENTNINDDIVFEIELIKQVEVNIDYILMLIKKYQESHQLDKEIKISILKSIDSSIELRSKKDLIENFIASLTPDGEVDKTWKTFIEEQRREEIERIIQDESLNRDKTIVFINNAFRDGFVSENGTAISEILPPMRRFSRAGADRTEKKINVLTKLKEFYEKFKDLITTAILDKEQDVVESGAIKTDG